MLRRWLYFEIRLVFSFSAVAAKKNNNKQTPKLSRFDFAHASITSYYVVSMLCLVLKKRLNAICNQQNLNHIDYTLIIIIILLSIYNIFKYIQMLQRKRIQHLMTLTRVFGFIFCSSLFSAVLLSFFSSASALFLFLMPSLL